MYSWGALPQAGIELRVFGAKRVQETLCRFFANTKNVEEWLPTKHTKQTKIQSPLLPLSSFRFSGNFLDMTLARLWR